MAIQAAATRAPRGTKILTQAFFEAADGIPEPQRDAVVKAALAAIRDQLKDTLAKAKVTKAKTKAAAGKAAPSRRPTKAAAPAAKKQRAVVAKVAKGKKAASGPQGQESHCQTGLQAVRQARAQGNGQAGTRDGLRAGRCVNRAAGQADQWLSPDLGVGPTAAGDSVRPQDCECGPAETLWPPSGCGSTGWRAVPIGAPGALGTAVPVPK